MTSTKTCPFHNKELVHRQGKSAKTGKEYDFYGCSNKDEQGQYCSHTEPGEPIKSGSQLVLEELATFKLDVMDKLQRILDLVEKR